MEKCENSRRPFCRRRLRSDLSSESENKSLGERSSAGHRPSAGAPAAYPLPTAQPVGEVSKATVGAASEAFIGLMIKRETSPLLHGAIFTSVPGVRVRLRDRQLARGRREGRSHCVTGNDLRQGSARLGRRAGRKVSREREVAAGLRTGGEREGGVGEAWRSEARTARGARGRARQGSGPGERAGASSRVADRAWPRDSAGHQTRQGTRLGRVSAADSSG